MKNERELIITVGLQASGKSTWANEFVKKHPNYRKVERDEIRMMLFGQRWTGKPEDEELVTKVQEDNIILLNAKGYSVVVSDTNLNPKTVLYLNDLADNLGMKFTINNTFMDVSLHDCIERDKARGSLVGESVIRDTYAKWINPPKRKRNMRRQLNLVKHNDSLQDCVIFDVDGTLTLGPKDRSPFEWDKVDQDEPNYYVIDRLQDFYDKGYKIFIFSGRDGISRPKTLGWIGTYMPFIHRNAWGEQVKLVMRPVGDNRPDEIVKQEFYEAFVFEQYNVVGVFDDRLKVCRMWHRLGLPLFKVGDPDADF